MRFQEYFEKLETIKYLIEHKRAGTPHSLSKKLNVSESTLDRMIRILKDQGYPITFNRFRNTYEFMDFLKKNASIIFWCCGCIDLYNIDL